MIRVSRYQRCIMILADGARADVLRDLAKRGRLPEIGGQLVDLGFFADGVTAFPSTTGPAYLPYLTGCYPGTCNLPGIRWFDKECYAKRHFSKNRFRSYVGAESFYLNGDLDRSHPTLFEQIPRSVNIFSSVNRGVGFFGNKTKFSRIWYWYYSHLTDHWGLVDEAAGEKTLQALEEDFEFLFVVFPGIDEFSHLSSPFHRRTEEAYGHLDRAVGKIVKKLRAQGKFDETMIWIVSDHGLSETKKHFALNQFLEASGIRTLYYPKVVFKWGFEAASMVSGNGMANLYFQNGTSWEGRAFWEDLQKRDRILDRLLEQPEVDLMAGQRGDGSIVVKSKRGEAILEEGEGGIQYSVKTTDPFGYLPMPERMTNQECFEKTATTEYPDAPVQLLQIFRSRRAGDLILSAAKGSDLRQRHEIPEHKSSHGSLHWEHMQVPILSNVKLSSNPKIFRSVDVFPTVLKLLGRPIPPGIDGSLPQGA